MREMRQSIALQFKEAKLDSISAAIKVFNLMGGSTRTTVLRRCPPLCKRILIMRLCMSKLLKYVTPVVLGMFLCSGQGCCLTKIRVAAQLGTDPKFIQMDDGSIIGLCIDIMRAIEHVDPTLKFIGDQHWMPLTRISAELTAGQQDAACAMQYTEARNNKFLFLEPALYPVDFMLLARADDPIRISNWDNLREFIPKPIVLVNRGFGASAILAEVGGIQVDANTTDTKQNLNKLVAGRARLYFHRGPGLVHILERAGVVRKIRVLPVSMLHTTFHFVVGRHLAPEIVNHIRYALVLLDQNGELDRLYKKWN
ncbi:ABC transporter substrate-binding protein [Duganella sp. BJB475]|nr:ABC transporter substrate-binding protein [Duganella sp. BJB475]RFP25409.1 ABC transporter substrate-binding protein [Duganella sp. BJB476]